MKKGWIVLLLGFVLSGCAAQETFETLADEVMEPEPAAPRQILVELPDEAVSPVLEDAGEQIYLCQDYEIIIETVASGDVNSTMERICGYRQEDLTVLETQTSSGTRYDFVWACAGESGDRLGRAVILDDGDYHYCMSVVRDADTTKTSQIVWSNVFSSFDLA